MLCFVDKAAFFQHLLRMCVCLLRHSSCESRPKINSHTPGGTNHTHTHTLSLSLSSFSFSFLSFFFPGFLASLLSCSLFLYEFTLASASHDINLRTPCSRQALLSWRSLHSTQQTRPRLQWISTHSHSQGARSSMFQCTPFSSSFFAITHISYSYNCCESESKFE